MEQKQYDVFISYSHEDRLVAEGVCGYLESNKIRCFIDYRDIPKGATWPSVIPPAIRNSGLMLAIFSHDFNASEQTDNEISIAANRKIPILVFRITNDSFDGTKEYFLTKSNWIEAFPQPEQYFGELYHNICILLGVNVDDGGDVAPHIAPATNHGSKEEEFIQKGLRIWQDAEGDWEMAAYYFRKAAKEGSAEGAYLLGMAYYDGKGIGQSWDDAINWFSQAAEKDYAGALYQLGRIYRYGIGVERNQMRALDYYTKAAAGGNGKAMKELGQVYHTGELGVQDEERSKEYYKSAFDTLYDQALGEDNAEAQCALGNSYLDGEGVKQNYQQAVKMFQRAAKHNYAVAFNVLGICYDSGLGVNEDAEKSFELTRRAAELGLPIAMNNLANDYLNGHGVDADPKKSQEWRLRSAECGDISAQTSIGYDYYDVSNPNRDCQQAKGWLERAAKGGSLQALYLLGYMYQNREITALESWVTGFQLVRQAAISGYVSSYYLLASYYEEGRGTRKNIQEAMRWYQTLVDLYKATLDSGQHIIVEQNGAGRQTFNDIEYYAGMLVSAMERLEALYKNGEGVKQNLYQASLFHQMAEKLRNKYQIDSDELESGEDQTDSETTKTVPPKKTIQETASYDKAMKHPRTDWDYEGSPSDLHCDKLTATLFASLKKSIDYSAVSRNLEVLAESDDCKGACFLQAFNTFMYNYHGYCQQRGIEAYTKEMLSYEDCVPYCPIDTAKRYTDFVHQCFLQLADDLGIDRQTLKENLNDDDYMLDLAESVTIDMLQMLIIEVADINIAEEGSRLFNMGVFFKAIGHCDGETAEELNVVIDVLKNYHCLPETFRRYTPNDIAEIFI